MSDGTSSPAPDNPQKKNDGCADHACWEYSAASMGMHYMCQQPHGIPPVVPALLDETETAVALEDSDTDHGQRRT